jgi:hypothetical protein
MTLHLAKNTMLDGIAGAFCDAEIFH